MLQQGTLHCFKCHKDIESNEHHSCLEITVKNCNENCNPKWQLSWDNLKKDMPKMFNN